MDASALASAESWLSIIGSAKLVAAFLVAIGVAIEFGGDWVAKPFEKAIEDARKLELIKLTKETARLSAEAESSRAAVADANARAAEAKLELEKFKAPRLLTIEQGARIADKLKAFSGTRYDAGIGPKGDPEPLYLLRGIANSLSLAGWVQVPWSGAGAETYTQAPMPAVGLTMVTNVIVDVHPDQWAKLGPAATALAEALEAEGIDAIADSRPTTIHNDLIHLRIGRKL